MNFKTTTNLLDVGSKRCFIKFHFYFEGVTLVARGALPYRGGARAPSELIHCAP